MPTNTPGRSGMRLSSAGSSTGQFPDPPGDGDGSGGDGSTTRMLVKPVFTRDSERRRKLLVRGGYLAAAGCVAYLAMVLVSVFASPSARPATDASQGADQTSVQQVTPERPTQKPSPPLPGSSPPPGGSGNCPVLESALNFLIPDLPGVFVGIVCHTVGEPCAPYGGWRTGTDRSKAPLDHPVVCTRRTVSGRLPSTIGSAPQPGRTRASPAVRQSLSWSFGMRAGLPRAGPTSVPSAPHVRSCNA